MAIGKNKKRYYVTLTPAHVDRFQGLCKRLNLPPSTMSNAIDDLIGNLSDTFHMALDNRKMDVSDLFQLMATQMKSLEEGDQERKSITEKEIKNVPEQKRRTVRNSKNAV